MEMCHVIFERRLCKQFYAWCSCVLWVCHRGLDSMLKKTPKSSVRRFISTTAKILFVAEAIAFVGSYGIWYQLNTKREFRHYMYKNCNWVLEGYYSIGEKLSDNEIRKLDRKIWQQEGKL